MDKEIFKIPKRYIGIWPLPMGVLLTGYAAPMKHNDPASMKRHLHPLKIKKKPSKTTLVLTLLYPTKLMFNPFLHEYSC